MKWHEKYPQDQQPSLQQITHYIQTPLWLEFNQFIETNYHVTPTLSYSRCTIQPGWNLKFKKSGKALCTAYPKAGLFYVLISIGSKQTAEAECLLPFCSDYIRRLYHNNTNALGSKWLMVKVDNATVLEEVKALIKIRVKPKPAQH